MQLNPEGNMVTRLFHLSRGVLMIAAHVCLIDFLRNSLRKGTHEESSVGSPSSFVQQRSNSINANRSLYSGFQYHLSLAASRQ